MTEQGELPVIHTGIKSLLRKDHTPTECVMWFDALATTFVPSSSSDYLIWRSEHEAIVLLSLQQAPQSLELMDLGEHSFSGQQHIQVAAFVQHLTDGSDGAVQFSQTLMQLLHLQVQRLGFYLADLLHLKRERIRMFETIRTQYTRSFCRESNIHGIRDWPQQVHPLDGSSGPTVPRLQGFQKFSDVVELTIKWLLLTIKLGGI